MAINPVNQTPSLQNPTGLKDAVEKSLINNEIPPLLYIKTSDSPGVYFHWDRKHYTGVAYYRVQRSKYPDSGVWEDIASLPWPQNEYIDINGAPSYFYRVEEITPDFKSLGFSAPFPADEVAIKASLVYQLSDLMHVPIIDEDGTFNRDRTSVKFALGRWAADPAPEISISGFNLDGDRDARIILDTYTPIYSTVPGEPNYPNGLKIRLDYNGAAQFVDANDNVISLHSTDTIKGSYHVQFFTHTQMNDALHLALQTLAAQPGTVKYTTLIGIPPFYDPALITGASYYLYRSLLHSMLNRQVRYVLQNIGGEGADSFNASEYLKGLVDTYQKDWEAMLKTVPIAYYPRILSVVIPDMYLPGGRSRFFRYAWKGGA